MRLIFTLDFISFVSKLKAVVWGSSWRNEFLKACTAWKVSVFGVILVRIFSHSDGIRRDSSYLSVFSPNAWNRGQLFKDILGTRFFQKTEIHLFLSAYRIRLTKPSSSWVRLVCSNSKWVELRHLSPVDYRENIAFWWCLRIKR